ncbi:ligase-associated DNA damage response exonuclease [uncultured Sphingomonas sp.]|uniref:ligase-associated DNA damage response exonuclease n=1 Tax=uncultured Sphingomonas sp. TaxID=158754 RepID=UPI0035CB6DD4
MANGSSRLGDWIEPHPHGIYVRPADAWIDPSEPVARALITHGHADHARGGHGAVWATPQTLAIMDCRYGAQAGHPVEYGQTIRMGPEGNEVDVGYVPAGHVLGSAQIVLDWRGERIVVSGDYKRRADPTCAPFEPVKCDVFVTEATFALPVFRHPDTGDEIDKLVAALHANPDRCVLVGAYALGKAQRVIAELRVRGHEAPIYLHGALQRLCDLYVEQGVVLGDLRPAAGVAKAEIAGHVVMCPPSALNDRWSRRLPDPITAMASGWMRVRQRARQKNVELPLILSDHADWDELTDTLTEIAPKEVWVTHGREEALVHWCAQRQMKARALALVGFEDEDD